MVAMGWRSSKLFRAQEKLFIVSANCFGLYRCYRAPRYISELVLKLYSDTEQLPTMVLRTA